MLVLEAFLRRADDAGFDLARTFATGDWNAHAPPEHRLPDFGRTRALAVVMGNSAALWPRFLTWVAAEPSRRHLPDPLDDYTEKCLTSAVAITGVRAELCFAHRPPYLPIQRMGDLAGLAHLQPSHLCVHPALGPWIAMRAVIILDADGPSLPVARTAPPCDCTRGCGPAFERAVALGFDQEHEPTWRAWVAIRDACPVGHRHRYPDDQIRYHYAKDRSALRPVTQDQADQPETQGPGPAGTPGPGRDPSA